MPDAGERTWHKDGPLAHIEAMADWADQIASQQVDNLAWETAQKIATNLRDVLPEVVSLSRLRAGEETLDRTLEEGQRTRLRLLGEVRAAEEREENLRHQRGLLVQELAVLAHTLRPFAQHEPGVVYDKHDSLETVVDHILEAFGEQGR